MKSIKRNLGHRVEWRNSNRLLHREDGPALIYHTFNISFWFINGIEYTAEEYKREIIKINLSKLVL